jgi:hypothetical protein
MDQAACGNHPNPDIWYPDQNAWFSVETREAQAICYGCPVREACFEFGRDERIGIYGGVVMGALRNTKVNPNLPGPVPGRAGAGRLPRGPVYRPRTAAQKLPVPRPSHLTVAKASPAVEPVEAADVPAVVEVPAVAAVAEVVEVAEAPAAQVEEPVAGPADLPLPGAAGPEGEVPPAATEADVVQWIDSVVRGMQPKTTGRGFLSRVRSLSRIR